MSVFSGSLASPLNWYIRVGVLNFFHTLIPPTFPYRTAPTSKAPFHLAMMLFSRLWYENQAWNNKNTPYDVPRISLHHQEEIYVGIIKGG